MKPPALLRTDFNGNRHTLNKNKYVPYHMLSASCDSIATRVELKKLLTELTKNHFTWGTQMREKTEFKFQYSKGRKCMTRLFSWNSNTIQFLLRKKNC